MWDTVWGGCQPQPWWNRIVSTPQMTKISKIFGQLGWWNSIWGCIYMPLRWHANTSNTLYMSNMDVGSSLRWMWASTIIQLNHFHSTSDPEFQNLGPTVLCNDKGAPLCLWDSIPIPQTLYICLIWIWEAVWGKYQPQPWCNGVISTAWRPRWLDFERDSSKMTSKIAPSEKFLQNITELRHRIAPSLFQDYYYEFPYIWIFRYWFLYVVCLWASLLHRHICWALKY